MKEITVVANDRIGLLADLSETLALQKINIVSLSAESTGRTGIVRLMVEKPAEAKKALEEKGFKVVDADLLVLHLQDKPGELARVTRLLANEGIAISNVLMLSREANQTVLAMSVSDYAKAKRALKL